jgi:predicted ATPase
MQRVASGRSAPARLYPRVSREVREWASPWESDLAKLDSIDPGAVSSLLKKRGNNSALQDLLKELGMARDARLKDISAYHSSLEIQDFHTGEWSNLSDVGYGISQAMPILMACVSRSTGPLIIEQPEIHLHPAAQGKVADVLLRTSSRRQVILETHSEHIINKVRIAVASGEIPAKNVMIIYVDRTASGSQITQIPLKRNGDFAREWPLGFFDERYRDVLELARLDAQ